MKDFTFNRRTALRMTAATAMTFLMRAYPAGASGKPRDILWEDLIPAASAPQPADKSTSLFDNSGPPPEQSMVGNDVVRELAEPESAFPDTSSPWITMAKA